MSVFNDQMHHVDVTNVHGGLGHVLSACQLVISKCDALTALQARWADAVTAGTLTQTSLDELDALKADLGPLYAACVTYRDAHQ